MLMGPAEVLLRRSSLWPHERVRETVERALRPESRAGHTGPIFRRAQRASAGLIISEATQVTPMGQGYPETPGIHAEDQLRSWRSRGASDLTTGRRASLRAWVGYRAPPPSKTARAEAVPAFGCVAATVTVAPAGARTSHSAVVSE